MKKTLLPLALLIMVGCAKDQMVEVTFSTMESNSLTKATRVDTIQARVAERIGRTMELSLASTKTGTTYRTMTDEPILLPISAYKVTGATEVAELHSIREGASAFSDSPLLTVEETIRLTSGKTDYPLNAKFGCFGLVINTTEVEAVEYEYPLGSMSIPFAVKDNYGLIFVNGDLGNDVLKLYIHPKNWDNGDTRELRLSGIPQSGCTVVERGRYYVLHANEVEKVESGFMLNVPKMGEVDLK